MGACRAGSLPLKWEVMVLLLVVLMVRVDGVWWPMTRIWKRWMPIMVVFCI